MQTLLESWAGSGSMRSPRMSKLESERCASSRGFPQCRHFCPLDPSKILPSSGQFDERQTSFIVFKLLFSTVKCVANQCLANVFKTSVVDFQWLSIGRRIFILKVPDEFVSYFIVCWHNGSFILLLVRGAWSSLGKGPSFRLSRIRESCLLHPTRTAVRSLKKLF